jgi:hypothetical protein
MKPVDAENHMDLLMPGEALFSLIGRLNTQVVFLVRDRSAVIKYFGETSVDVRSDLFLLGQVVLTVVVFSVGRHVRKEYVTWWDYHQAGCADIFQVMTTQDFLSFHFYGDNGRRDRTFVTTNPLKGFFSEAIVAILKLSAWSEDDFLAARLKICSRFPTPRGLWDNMPHINGKE